MFVYLPVPVNLPPKVIHMWHQDVDNQVANQDNHVDNQDVDNTKHDRMGCLYHQINWKKEKRLWWWLELMRIILCSKTPSLIWDFLKYIIQEHHYYA